MTWVPKGQHRCGGEVILSSSNDGYPVFLHHGAHTLLLLLNPEPGLERGPVGTRGLVGMRMLSCSTPSWEG